MTLFRVYVEFAAYFYYLHVGDLCHQSASAVFFIEEKSFYDKSLMDTNYLNSISIQREKCDSYLDDYFLTHQIGRRLIAR